MNDPTEETLKEIEQSKQLGKSKDKDVQYSDFNLIKVLGRGGFGKVYLVEKKDTGKAYVMKALKKYEILNPQWIDLAEQEMDVLLECDHPFLMNMDYVF